MDWTGPKAPFGFGSNGDVETSDGADAVGYSIRQILGTGSTRGTRIGELPWRPSFGSELRWLVNSSMSDDSLRDAAKRAVIESVRRWEPRARLTAVNVTVKVDSQSGARIVEGRVSYALASVTSGGQTAQYSADFAV